MNKAQLADVIAEKVGISKKQAEETLDVLTSTITKRIKSGEEVTLTGFGAFSSKVRKGRIGVNPRNPKEQIEIKPTRVVKFKAGKNLKEALKAKEGEASEVQSSPPPAPQAPVEPSESNKPSEPSKPTETETSETSETKSTE